MEAYDPPTRRARSTTRSKLRELNKRDYILGVLLLLGVVTLWTLSNFVTQGLFEDGYDKPFLVTYINTSAFAFYLIPTALRRIRDAGGKRKGRPHVAYQPIADGSQALDADPTVAGAGLLSVVAPPPSAPDRGLAPPLTERETAELALAFALVWFAANWALNTALEYTSVASATICSGTSGFFTLAVGRMFRVETLTSIKIVSVVTSFVGVILVSLSDSASSLADTVSAPRPVLGDVLAFLSALFYALYVTLLKVRIGDESRVDMQLFFGFVGLFNVVGLWPLGVLLHVLGVERFEPPRGGKVLGAILVNMFITWLSDYMYVIAMLKTTPVLVTIGLSLTIPLAMVVDFLLGRPSTAQVVFGALLVLGSFVLVGLSEAKEEEDAALPVFDGGATQVSLHEETTRRSYTE